MTCNAMKREQNANNLRTTNKIQNDFYSARLICKGNRQRKVITY